MSNPLPNSEPPPTVPPSPAPAPVPPEPEPPPEGRGWNEMSVLAPLLAFYTAGYLALMLADFLLRESFTMPAGLMPVYISLLGAYAADKEIRRWIGRPEPPRKGTVFVYLWLVIYMALFVISSFWTDFQMPSEMLSVVLQVLGVFFGSRASKMIYDKKKDASGSDDSRLEVILSLIDASGSVTSRQVAERFNVSDRTARRMLDDWVESGRLKREGAARGTVYTKAE